MEFRPFVVDLSTPFRGTTQRRGVLLRGTGPDGADAWGEYSPFPDYSVERASRWWRAAMEAARGEWPAPVRDEVSVNSIVPEVGPAEAARFATAGGCRTAKVKVGAPGAAGLAADVARVEAVAAALGPGGTVRVDANGAWSVDEAVLALKYLERAVLDAGGQLEYAEQPCRTIEELALVRRRTSVLIAADESIRIPTDPLAVVRAGAADIVILKVHPLGGVRACLELAEQVGIPVVVSSAMESSVGLAACVALARALPDLPYACGLGTGALLKTDTVRTTWVPEGGMLRSMPLDVIV